MTNSIKTRAETPEQKAEVMKRILECWQTSFPTMRLGQLLLNLVDQEPQLWLIEDTVIADRLEAWAKKCKDAGYEPGYTYPKEDNKI